MAYKALKDADGKICVDSNGNIMLVDMGSTPGPGPGPTPTGITNGVAVEYGDDFYFMDEAFNTVRVPASQWYDYVTEHGAEGLQGICRTMEVTISGSSPYFTGYQDVLYGPALYMSDRSYNMSTDYIAGVTGIENARYLYRCSEYGATGYPLGIKQLYETIGASEVVINLTNAEFVSVSGNKAWLNLESGIGNAGFYPIMMVIDMTQSESLQYRSDITSESAVYKAWAGFGINVLDYMSTHPLNTVFNGSQLLVPSHYVVNMPNMRVAESPIIQGYDDGYGRVATASLYFGSQLNSVVQTGGSLIDMYIPRTDAVPYGSVTADTNVYVPSDMVAAYQSANGWSSCSIHAYTF